MEYQMGDYVIVEWGYNKVYDDELALSEGELVRITHRKNEAGEEGWWQGIKEDGSRGCFPYNYVRPASEEEIRPITIPGAVKLTPHIPAAPSGSDLPAKEGSIALVVKSPPVNNTVGVGAGSGSEGGSPSSTSTSTSPPFLQKDGGSRSVKDLKNILGNTIADGLSKSLKTSPKNKLDSGGGRVSPPNIISTTTTSTAADVSPTQMKGHVKGKRSLSESSVQSALVGVHGAGGGSGGMGTASDGEATEIKMKTERSQSMTGTMKRKSKALPVAPGTQPSGSTPVTLPPPATHTLKSIPEASVPSMELQSSPAAASGRGGDDDLISATVASTAPVTPPSPAEKTPSVTESPREAITSLSSDIARSIIASDITVDNARDVVGSPKGKPNSTFRKQLNKLLFVERMIKGTKDGRKEEDLSSLILSPTTSAAAEPSLAESDKTPSPMSPQSPEDLKVTKIREMEKMTKSRTFVIQEILDTEKSFIDSLESVIERYYNPLVFTSCPGVVKLLSIGDVAILFNSWKAMIAVNSLLLSKMQSRVLAAKDDIVPLGDIFCDYTPLFSIYGTYATKHDAVLGAIHEMRVSDPAVGALLDKCDASDKVDLTSLMIKPIQRVPRYILLLKDLQRNTPPDHPEYEQIQNALVLLGAMAVHINESVRDAERHEEMLQVNQSFQADGLNFMAPFRYLIHQGSITLVSSAATKKYSIFLFSDIVVMTNQLSSGYKFVGAIDNEGLAVDDIPNVSSLGLKHAFQITGTNKCFLAVATDGEEKKQWQDAFMKMSLLWKVSSLRRTQSSSHQKKYELVLYKYRPTLINYRDDAPALGVERRTTCDICDKPFTEFQMKYRCFVTKNLLHDSCSTVCSKGASGGSYRISIRSIPREESEVNIDDEIRYTKRKLVQLDKELKGARSLNLGTKPRKFIREGPILRVSKQSGPQILHFTLLSDLLIYSSTDTGVASTIYIGQIPLYSLDIDESVNYGDGVYAFSLSFSGKVSMTLVFTDVLVKDSWLFDIQTTTQELLDSTGAPSKSPPKPRTKSITPMESFRNIRQASVNSFTSLNSDRSSGAKSLDSDCPKITLALPLPSVVCPSPVRRSSASSSLSSAAALSPIVSPSSTAGGSTRPLSLASGKSERGEGGWKDTLKGMTSVFVKAKERRKSEHVEESLDRSLERRPSRELLLDRHILKDASGL